MVEDDPDIRFLVRVNFMSDGDFEVKGEASDAESAIAAASSSSPDLIVLDHLLEGAMTGFEAAPFLKKVAPQCKIVLFTASEELRERAKDSLSVDAFLLKTDIAGLVPLARRLFDLG